MPRNVTVTFSDGTQHAYENIPDGVTPDQVEQRAQQDFAGKQVKSIDGGAKAATAPTEQPGIIASTLGQIGDAGKKYVSDTVGGTVDAAKKWMSSFSANPIKNAAGTSEAALTMGTGALSAPLALAAKMSGNTRSTEDIRKDLTYEPRTDSGKAIIGLVGATTKPVNDVIGLGAKGISAVTPMNQDTAQAAIDTAFLYKGGRMAADAIAKKISPPPTLAQQTAQATADAENYVRNNTGLDWDSLSEGIKGKITEIAKNAGDLQKLDPKALEREAQLQSLPVPVPATRGQLTRDPVALRNEGNVSATKGGAPIREVHLDQNQALLDNLDVLKGKVSGTGETAAKATSADEAGASIQGAARGKLELVKAKVRSLYKQADESGETLQKVDTQPVRDLIAQLPDADNFKYAKGWLERNTEGEGSGSTIRDLEALRKQAVAKSLNGGEDAHYAGQLIQTLDQITDGAGGKLYQAARAARKAQALEFEDQGAIGKLVENKSRTDRAIALENTVGSITKGSIEDIQKVKESLLTGGDAATRTAGKQAWREVRAQVIDDIKDRATKSVAIDERGNANLTPAALKKAIDSYGPKKLDEIFGPGTHRQIYDILDATQTVKTLPPSRAVGSSTFANALTFLEDKIRSIPGGGVIPDVVRGVTKLKDLGGDDFKAQQATVTPLSEAIKKADKKSTARVGKNGVPPIPLSQFNQQQGQAK